MVRVLCITILGNHGLPCCNGVSVGKSYGPQSRAKPSALLFEFTWGLFYIMVSPLTTYKPEPQNATVEPPKPPEP